MHISQPMNIGVLADYNFVFSVVLNAASLFVSLTSQ